MLIEENTSKRKSAISEAESDQQIGEFWDDRDLADYWEETVPAEFTVNLQSEVTYYRVEVTLSEQIRLSSILVGTRHCRVPTVFHNSGNCCKRLKVGAIPRGCPYSIAQTKTGQLKSYPDIPTLDFRTRQCPVPT
jgi:hypothetical protein